MPNEPPKPIDDALRRAHRDAASGHQSQRAALLARVGDSPAAPASLPLSRRSTHGLAIAAVVLIALGVLVAGPSAVSAMDRMAEAVQRVGSYSWRMESVYELRGGQARRVRQVNVGRWRREPLALHATTRAVESTDPNAPDPQDETVLIDLAETHHAARGVVIDHVRREYFWTPGIEGVPMPGESPQAVIFKVRTRRGRVTRDLGEREIAGVRARGVEIVLDDEDPATEEGAATPASPEGQALGWDWRNVTVRAWCDPATDLPIEFELSREGEHYKTSYRYTDLRWGEAFGPDAFAIEAPEGYTEIHREE